MASPTSRPGLVDHLGRPIDTSVLQAPIAGPSLMTVRSIISGHPAEGLTPHRLVSLLRASEDGDMERYLELAEDMEERDLHYLGVLGTRKRAVTQLEITVTAASDDADHVKQADFIRDWLDRDTLEDELFDVMDGLGKGFSLVEIIWDLTERQWIPGRLEWRDPRWFWFDRIDGRTPLLRGAGLPQPLPPFKFVNHQPKAKSGIPIRGGLARAAAWAWLFKNYALKDWVAFAEVFGLPLRMGKYAPGETEENIRLLMQAVAQIGSDAAAVIPQNMQIEFVDGKQSSAGGSAEVFERLCNFLDQQVSKGVLGQTATTDAIAGGHAVGKEHNEVRGDIERADCKQLAATLNRDLVRPAILLNFGPQAKYPKIEIGRSETVDVDKMSNALARLVPLGLKVSSKEVRDKIGFTDPEDGEEVLGVNANAPAVEFTGQPKPTPGGPQSAPPEPGAKPPQPAAPGPGGRPTPGQGQEKGLLALSEPLKEAPNAAASGAGAAGDGIDAGVDVALGDWEPLAEPLVRPVEELLAACNTIEEARERLTEAMAALGDDELVTLLARAGFNARAAGLLGAQVKE